VVVDLFGVDVEVVDDKVFPPVLDEEEEEDHCQGDNVEHDLASARGICARRLGRRTGESRIYHKIVEGSVRVPIIVL
jgi:hypothetical protein